MRLHQIPSIGVAAGVALLLAGCANESQDAECEQIYNETISPVDGVASVEVDCSSQFGGGWKRVNVHVATNNEDELWKIADDVDRALAENPDIGADWRTPANYFLKDGTEFHGGGHEVQSEREDLGIDP